MRLWLLGAAVIVALAIVGFFYIRTARSARQAKTEGPVIGTVPVVIGDLNETVRISGTIAAERFAAIIAPRLRGSRGDRGRGGAAGGVDLSVATVSTATGNTNSTSGGSSTTSSDANGSLLGNAASSSSSSSVSETGATSSLGAKRGTVNRFVSSKAATSSRSSGSTGSITTASSSAASTSTAQTGGGGGGGMDDFHMVLLNVAKPGSTVRKGDVVAEFDRQNMLVRLDDYRASVAQMNANLKKLRADQAVALEAHRQLVRAANSDVEKAALDLKTIAVRSAIEAETYKLNAEEAKARYQQVLNEAKLFTESMRAQLRAAEIDRDQANIELQRAEANADRMIIKAPIDGIIVMQSIFRGGDFGQVQQGDQVHAGQFFMSIVDPSSMVVTGAINQVDAEMLRIGMKATAHVDAYPDMAMPATVTGVGAMTSTGGWRASYMREIPVRLKLDQIDPRVIPDLSASADIILRTEKQTAIAPRLAIFQEAGSSRPFVFLKGPEGWVRRDIELGLANHVAAAVRSGLQKGDRLAVQRPL